MVWPDSPSILLLVDSMPELLFLENKQFSAEAYMVVADWESAVI